MSEKVDYFKIMEALDINQMILQGPPGTSKTHTAKEIVKEIVKNKIDETLNSPVVRKKHSSSEVSGKKALSSSAPMQMLSVAGTLGSSMTARNNSKTASAIYTHPMASTILTGNGFFISRRVYQKLKIIGAPRRLPTPLLRDG